MSSNRERRLARMRAQAARPADRPIPPNELEQLLMTFSEEEANVPEQSQIEGGTVNIVKITSNCQP